MIEDACIPKSLLGSEPPDPNVSKKWCEQEMNFCPVWTTVHFDSGCCGRWCSPSPPLSLDTLSSPTWLPGPQPSLRPAPWWTVVALFLLILKGFHGSGFPAITVRTSKTWVRNWGATEWVSHSATSPGCHVNKGPQISTLLLPLMRF